MTAPDPGLVACVDAGGSSTRARAARDGVVVFSGTGGPANPTTVAVDVLDRSLRDALDGCPTPSTLLAAVAGAGSARTCDEVAALLVDRFPTTEVTVVPDFVGAFWSCPPATEVCVVAGTGSVVVSPGSGPAEPWRISGGRGWILGDDGSASDLGRALLRRYADDPSAWPAPAGALADLYGAADWRHLARTVQTAPVPARLLARAAPVLTSLVETGDPQAVDLLAASLDRLAALTARHLDRHLDRHRPGAGSDAGSSPVGIGLVGGVWTSAVARTEFTAALTRRAARDVVVRHDVREPVDGMVERLAAERLAAHR